MGEIMLGFSTEKLYNQSFQLESLNLRNLLIFKTNSIVMIWVLRAVSLDLIPLFSITDEQLVQWRCSDHWKQFRSTVSFPLAVVTLITDQHSRNFHVVNVKPACSLLAVSSWGDTFTPPLLLIVIPRSDNLSMLTNALIKMLAVVRQAFCSVCILGWWIMNSVSNEDTATLVDVGGALCFEQSC